MVKDNYIIEEAIRLVNDGVSVTLPVNGYSMLPFIIGGKESVILQRPAELKVGDILLLDEISSSLDEPTERELYSRIFAAHPNKTMLFITHRQTVCQLCDNTIIDSWRG